MNVQYTRFDMQDMSYFQSFVDCYRFVFADEPWNEWKVCKACGSKWGLAQREELDTLNFRHCDLIVEDFWPKAVVIQDLESELNSESSCYLAVCAEKVVGFCYGYPTTVAQLQQKLEIDIATKISTLFEITDNQQVAYQDDLGVITEYRRQGIAKKLFNLRLEDFKRQELSLGIVRTLQRPPSVTYSWYLKLGYQIIATYTDGRVVMARSLSDLVL